MQFLSIALTFIGCILLSFSLKPTRYLAKEVNQSGWKTLHILIIVFLVGYAGFLYYLFFHYNQFVIHLILATILLLGGLFVLMVTRLSFENYKKIIKDAKQTEYNSFHDILTGLPNRKHFLNNMAKHIAHSTPFTLFSLNLNNFKQVNDALGHYYGDQLLVVIGKRIEEKLHNLCMVFRISGDEFMIILENSTDVFHSDIINRVHSAFDETYQLMHYNIESSISIGATKFPEDSDNKDTLLRYADLAMYAAKTTKKRCVFYHQALNEDASQKLEICGRIRNAIASEEFELYYQPILSAGSCHLHGAEVLIRWPQQDGTFIPPDLFIPLAEKAGLINQITQWVINKVIVQLVELDEKGFTGALHINLSAKDLQGESLFNLLSKRLTEKRVSPERLIFEITESAMMTDLAGTKNMIFRLAKHGFTFSIDDFGTGFSSLSLLKELPIQQIKIDRSFVGKMDCVHTDHAIVKSAIYLAKNLGCTVVAEGIENKRVETELVKLDCDYLQGYYYCKPLPLNEFIQRYCFR